MILTAHQPVYLPWLGLFHKIALADLFISFDQVQYQPKDWNSRNQIKTQDGSVWLTVPVQRKGYLEKRICEIEIEPGPWARKHWRALQVNYAKAPFFKRYADFFEDCYARDWKLLTDLNSYMLRWFLEFLGIGTPVKSAGEYQFQGRKSDLVLDMCVTVEADIYIFGSQGRGYADTQSFEDAGVRIEFQDYHHPVYHQQHGDFISNLSIVDLLFNCGPDSLDVLMSNNLTRTELMEKHYK
jgi:hypothetical protein